MPARFVRKFAFWVMLLACAFFTLFPIYWIFITSFKTLLEIRSHSPTFWPMNPVFSNYVNTLIDSRFDIYIFNSLIVTIAASIIVLIVSILGGYAIARYQFRGKSIVFAVLLGTQLISSLTMIVPLFRFFSSLGLINTLGCLVLAYAAGNAPFCLITISSFFQRIPVSLEEAALIDGCNRLTAVQRIILPVMLPGIVATFVFAFTGCWNEFFLSLMFITDELKRTIPVGLANFIGKYDINWGQMTAACVITLLPTIIMFLLVQKHIVSGLTQGAVKE